MAHVFLRGDTLAYAYRHSRINLRITQIKTAVGDKDDILVANGFQIHLDVRFNLRKKDVKHKKPGPEDIYLTNAVQRGIFA